MREHAIHLIQCAMTMQDAILVNAQSVIELAEHAQHPLRKSSATLLHASRIKDHHKFNQVVKPAEALATRELMASEWTDLVRSNMTVKESRSD